MKRFIRPIVIAATALAMSTAVYAAEPADTAAAITQSTAEVARLTDLVKQLEVGAKIDPQVLPQLNGIKAQLQAEQVKLNGLKAKVTAALAAQNAQGVTDPSVAAAQVSQAANAVAGQAGAALNNDPAAQAAIIAQLKGVAPVVAQQAMAVANQAQAAQANNDPAAQAALAQQAQAAQAALAQQLQMLAQAQAAQQAQAQQAQQAQAAQAAAAAQQAAAQAAQNPAVAAAAQSVAGAVHKYVDPNGASATFTADEWSYLLSKWAYTGQAEELITHHTVGDLKAVLAAR